MASEAAASEPVLFTPLKKITTLIF
jgi:hypothetical protein